MDVTQKAVMKKKKTRFFETYISKVLKKVSPENGITANSKQQLNSVICIISKLVSGQVTSLTEISKKKTISEKEVKNALRIILPERLFSKVIINGQNAIKTFKDDDNVKGSSRQEKAGIIFPPAQVEKFLRNFGYSKVMVTSNAPIFLAGALEYLSLEILKNASVFAKKNKRVRITIRDLEMGVRNDEELDALFTSNRITFLGGGINPFIHPSLLPKKNRKKRAKKNPSDGEKKHRFRPGTVSLRDIRRFQNMSNCLTFSKSPFEKFVREVTFNHKSKDVPMKISKAVFIILQYFVEQRVVEILKNANFAAIHAGRVKLMPIDIEFVTAVTNGIMNPYQKVNDTETLEDSNNLEEDVEDDDVEEDVEDDVEDDVEEDIEEEDIEEEDIEEEDVEDIEEDV